MEKIVKGVETGLQLSWDQALEAFAKNTITYIKRSMKPGTGRLYRSKREKGRVVQLGAIAKLAYGSSLRGRYARKEARTWVLAGKASETRTVYRNLFTGQFTQANQSGRSTYRAFIQTKDTRRLERGRHHIASVPGVPPAPDTETLKNSMGYTLTTNAGHWGKLYIYSDTPYARYMELGTHKVKARPFIRPAIYIYAKELPRLLALFNKQKGRMKIQAFEGIAKSIPSGEKEKVL